MLLSRQKYLRFGQGFKQLNVFVVEFRHTSHKLFSPIGRIQLFY